MLDTTNALGRTLEEIAEAHGFSGAEELVRAANPEGRPMDENSPGWASGATLRTSSGRTRRRGGA